MRVLSWGKHACTTSRIHAAHLRCHLIGCIVVTQDKGEDGAETEEVKEVPAGTRELVRQGNTGKKMKMKKKKEERRSVTGKAVVP